MMQQPPPGEIDPTRIKGSLAEAYADVPPLDDQQINPTTLFDREEFQHPVFGVLNQYIAKYAPPFEPISTDKTRLLSRVHVLPQFNAFLQRHILRHAPPETISLIPPPDTHATRDTEQQPPELVRVFTDVAEKFATAGHEKEALKVLDGGIQRGLDITGQHYTDLATIAAEHGDTTWAMTLALDSIRILHDLPGPAHGQPTDYEKADRITIWLERTSRINHAVKDAIAKRYPSAPTAEETQLDTLYAEEAEHFLDSLANIPRDVLMTKERSEPGKPMQHPIIERLINTYACFQKNTVSRGLAMKLATHIRKVPGVQERLTEIARRQAADRQARRTESILLSAIMRPS